MEDIKLVFQGFIIGIGKVIPGVSGAMFAMMFGVYEKALNIISNLKKELVKNLKFIVLLGLSILLAIIFGSNVIKYCLDKYYIETMFLFVGMMASGIKPLFKNIDKNKVSKKSLLIAFSVCLFLLLLDFVDVGKTTDNLDRNFLTVIMLFISGFLDALGTVVPGVCGTALLMILGYYNIVINSLSDLLNLSNIWNNLFVLIPFCLGMIVGILLISKVINYLFKNYKTETYITIIGFAIVSTIILFIKAISSPHNIFRLLISILLCIIGFFISKCLEKLGD